MADFHPKLDYRSSLGRRRRRDGRSELSHIGQPRLRRRGAFSFACSNRLIPAALAGLGKLVVVPDLDDVAIRVAKVCRTLSQALGSKRPLASWRELHSLRNQSSCER